MLVRKFASALNVAKILLEPDDEKLVVTVACPLPFKATLLPPEIATPLLVKLTVLSVTGVPEWVTVAVKVTELLGEAVKEGLLFEVRLVAVATAGALSEPDTVWVTVVAPPPLTETFPEMVPTEPVPASRT